jgi:uncharacterized membrane protein (UPF0127 family)
MITPSARRQGPLGLALAALISGSTGVGHAAPTSQGVAPQMLPIEARWCPHPTTAPTPTPPAYRGAIEAGCVALEVPRSWHQYAMGLQRRPALPPDRGMWFAYRPAQPARFWMHLTPQPLDLVFVRAGRVVTIQAAAPPCMQLPCPTYGSPGVVDGVLELAAGEASRRGLTVGSPLEVELLKPFGPSAPAPD